MSFDLYAIYVFSPRLVIAVQTSQTLTSAEKMDMISSLAEQTGRAIDLIDLKVVATSH